MIWFKFTNGTGHQVYVNLVNYDVAFVTHLEHAELYPIRYPADERYTVTGEDAKRLVRIMEREADRGNVANFGEPA